METEQKKTESHQKLKDRKRFVIDYIHDPEGLELVDKLLTEANKKSHGREITFKDLVIYALKKLGPKDLEKIKALALGEMDKVQMLLEKHNRRHGTKLTLGEFLVKQLKIT